MRERCCAECGAVLVRRKNERSPQWKKRRFCSRACGAQARAIRTPEQRAAKREVRRATWRNYYYRQRQRRAELAALPPERRAEILAMAEFLKRKGVTRCPPRYAAPTQSALYSERASERLATINTDHSSQSWLGQKRAARSVEERLKRTRALP